MAISPRNAMPDAIAIVLARGGSKRIPRKNIRFFHGKAMVCWPVAHAFESGLFREVIISTDDTEIKQTATAAGAVCYNLRPAEFSDDYATTADVLRYELETYAKCKGYLPDVCCCLYGTSVFAVPSLLAKALSALRRASAELTMAVIRYPHPIERALQFDAADLLHYRQPEFVLTRTQDIAPSYHDAGLFYIFDVRAFWDAGGASFSPLKKTAIEVTSRIAVDIDTEEDWEFAELLATKSGLV